LELGTVGNGHEPPGGRVDPEISEHPWRGDLELVVRKDNLRRQRNIAGYCGQDAQPHRQPPSAPECHQRKSDHAGPQVHVEGEWPGDITKIIPQEQLPDGTTVQCCWGLFSLGDAEQLHHKTPDAFASGANRFFKTMEASSRFKAEVETRLYLSQANADLNAGNVRALLRPECVAAFRMPDAERQDVAVPNRACAATASIARTPVIRRVGGCRNGSRRSRL
jgi:hypothetical protein